MANIKDSKEIEALHNDWCREERLSNPQASSAIPGKAQAASHKLQAASKGPERGQQCALR